MKRFMVGRCEECEQLIPLLRDGNVGRHYRLVGTHAHTVMRLACAGFGFPPRGEPVVIVATTARRARQLARAGTGCMSA